MLSRGRHTSESVKQSSSRYWKMSTDTSQRISVGSCSIVVSSPALSRIRAYRRRNKDQSCQSHWVNLIRCCEDTF
jgi:hypothetical protein